MKRCLISFTLLALICAIVSCKDDGGDGSAPVIKITVTTNDVTDISESAAKSGGKITSDGQPTISARGVCWGTTTDPTTDGSKTSDGTGKGEFISNLSGLAAGTKYYVRAYAVQGTETTYGNQVSFVAGQNVPTVTTSEVSNIGSDTAMGGGKVVSEGDKPVTEAGLCWSTSGTPTVDDANTVEDLETDGSFTSELIYLLPSTTYYVRAYATSEAGTGYGNQVTFKTGEETTVNIPDAGFLAYLVHNFDTNSDGKIQAGEARLITEIDLSETAGAVSSLEGIKSFINLRKLITNNTDNFAEGVVRNTIAAIDLSGMTSLEELWATGSGTTSLNITGCTALHTMHALFNNFTSIDVSTCTALNHLHLNENTTMVTCNFGAATTKLITLGLINTRVTQLDLQGRADLTEIWAGVGALQSVDVTGCTSLNKLIINENLGLTSITGLSSCSSLVEMNVVNTALASIDVNGCADLARLYANTCGISSLNITGCSGLNILYAGGNINLATITGLGSCTRLVEMELWVTGLTSVDVTGFNQLTKLWVCDTPGFTTLTGTNTCPNMGDLRVNNTAIASFDVTGCAQMLNLFTQDTPNLTTITGLNTCVNLEFLWAYFSQLSSLTIDNCKKLKDLRIFNSQVSTIDIYSGELLELHCGGNPNLASINVTRSPLMHTIFASACPLLVSLDVSKCAMNMNFLHLAENTAMMSLIMKTGQAATDMLLPTGLTPTRVD